MCWEILKILSCKFECRIFRIWKKPDSCKMMEGDPAGFSGFSGFSGLCHAWEEKNPTNLWVGASCRIFRIFRNPWKPDSCKMMEWGSCRIFRIFRIFRSPGSGMQNFGKSTFLKLWIVGSCRIFRIFRIFRSPNAVYRILRFLLFGKYVMRILQDFQDF